MPPTPSLKRAAAPLAIAHRGHSAACPENTLAAFEAAVAAGADMIECDVTLTADRHVVVIHDDRLERTTDGRGPVRQRRLAEVRRLDAGAWFDPGFAGQRVPTLAEVLRLAKGRILVNVEIKAGALDRRRRADGIEAQVVGLLRRHRMVRAALVSSFSRPLLARLAAMEAPPALALISETPADEDTAAFCRRIRAFSWHPDHRVLSAEQVARMHAHGLKVYPWTLLDAAEVRRALAMGADGVIVNDPALAVGLRAA